MRPTNLFEKVSVSFINASIALVLSAPLYWQWGNSLNWKLCAIGIFFLYEIVFAVSKEKRDLGMRIVGNYWQIIPSSQSYIFYNLFYSLSFATLFFYFWFPFDLFLVNILLLQLPMVILTKTTLHAYLFGLTTIKNPQTGDSNQKS